MATACWRLKRNCCLTPRQALAAWSVPMAALLAVAVFWAVQGWWWITLFALVDLAALVVALWLYARHALDGDTLALHDDGMLSIEQQRGPRLHRTVWHVSLVRLEVDADGALRLCSGRESVQVGTLATPSRREAMARELRRALCTGRR